MLKIADFLGTGAAEAKTGRELANYLNCDIRDVTEAIERERREGQPICAETGSNPGYYLAGSSEELKNYCIKLEHRANELKKTRRALLKALKKYAAKRSEEEANNGEAKGSP